MMTDCCKEILVSNDLNIPIETGNIYYDDTDTNGSIFEFMKNQQDFKMDFKRIWALWKTKYDLLSFKNTEYLLYRFNDFQNSIGESLIQVKHSVVTDNYIAAEEIQNQNWQYFIERVIEVCKSKEIGSTIKKSNEFLLTTVGKKMAKKILRNFLKRNWKKFLFDYE